MIRALSVVAVALFAVVLVPAVAVAQTADQKAAAQALFDEGTRLYNAGDFAQACGKLEASLAIVDALGTRGKLAQCFEKVGRTASAWAMWREVAVLAGRSGETRRQQFAQERAKALEPTLAYLTVEVPADNRVSGLTVKRGGSTVFAGAFGTPIAVDPGEVLVEADALGYESWSQVVKVAEGQRETVTVPALEPEPDVAPVNGPAETVTPAGADLSRDTAPSGTDPKLIAGIAGVGVGTVSITVGLLFGLQAGNTYDEAIERFSTAPPGMEAPCDAPDGQLINCSPMAANDAQRDIDDARSQAMLANVFTIGGVAIAATGAVLWILSGSDDEPADERGMTFVPTASPTSAGFALTGRF